MKKNTAIRYFGSKAALARALGIGRASVQEWDEIPLVRQCQLEVITHGALRADRRRLNMGPDPRGEGRVI